MLQQRLVASKERGGGGNGLNIFENFQDTWVVASDGAKLYEGDLVKKAVRIWVLCLPGMMFVADYVLSEEPLRLSSGFVMNNEDNRLNAHIYNPSRLVFRRGAEAVKLFLAKHVVDKAEADSELSFDWTFVHRRYTIQPNGPEQGREGSGLIYRWTGKTEGREQYRIHGLMMDREEMIKEWHMREEGGFIRLEAPDHENTLDFQFTPEGFAVRRHGLTGYWVL